VLDLGPAGRALPLICYEAIFPQHARAAERADYLLQLTNDAWFGTWSGPYQHLAQARMRAIEQGLPMIRAANTGVSAVIDPWGRITASLPLNEAGHVDAALPAARGLTVYARTGDLPWAALVLAMLGGLTLVQSRRAARDSD
jgi:apolipoprotein N-acyltransferase